MGQSTNKKKLPAQIKMRCGRVVLPEIRAVRSFDFEIALLLYSQVALEVLNSLENDRLMVLDVNKKGILSAMFDNNIIDLSSVCTKCVSIRKWLALGCQVIRWDLPEEIGADERGRGVLGFYKTNAGDVIYPVGGYHCPMGPAAFIGEMVINSEYFRPSEPNSKAQSLKFVIAHELTHVFDAMRILVPAFKNWGRFWRNVLQEGMLNENLRLYCRYQGTFVDDYGSANELEIVRTYWPSKADEWFAAGRGMAGCVAEKD